jgi:hypothetical protein
VSAITWTLTVTSAILTGSLLTKATGHHDRFYYAGSPGAGSPDVEAKVWSKARARAGRVRDLTARERRQALRKPVGGFPASSSVRRPRRAACVARVVHHP